MGNSGNISDRHAVTRDMSIILAKHEGLIIQRFSWIFDVPQQHQQARG